MMSLTIYHKVALVFVGVVCVSLLSFGGVEIAKLNNASSSNNNTLENVPTTSTPTVLPTFEITRKPTKPTKETISPTTKRPTKPTRSPTTEIPTHLPTTKKPSNKPSISPTTTKPSLSPTTTKPSISPTTKNPSISPTTKNPSFLPTNQPTVFPTRNPSFNPSKSPSVNPTIFPTKSPSFNPSKSPSDNPTLIPTMSPTKNPFIQPTQNPTLKPFNNPTKNPSKNPTTLSPTTFKPTTVKPTRIPTTNPTRNPTTKIPTIPTSIPTPPTKIPTSPTLSPTNPTMNPTNPTLNPTNPTMNPTNPTMNPTNPTMNPTNPTFSPTIPTTLNPTTSNPTIPTSSPINPTRLPSSPTHPGSSKRIIVYPRVKTLVTSPTSCSGASYATIPIFSFSSATTPFNTEFTSKDCGSQPTCYVVPQMTNYAHFSQPFSKDPDNSPRLLHAGTGKSLDYFFNPSFYNSNTDTSIYFCRHPDARTRGCVKVANSLSSFCEGYLLNSIQGTDTTTSIDYWIGMYGPMCNTISSCTSSSTGTGKTFYGTNVACNNAKPILCIAEITALDTLFVNGPPTLAPTLKPTEFHEPRWRIILSWAELTGVGDNYADKPAFESAGENGNFLNVYDRAECTKGERFLYHPSQSSNYFLDKYDQQDPILGGKIPVYFESEYNRIIAYSMTGLCYGLIENGIEPRNSISGYIWTGLGSLCAGRDSNGNSKACNNWTKDWKYLTDNARVIQCNYKGSDIWTKDIFGCVVDINNGDVNNGWVLCIRKEFV